MNLGFLNRKRAKSDVQVIVLSLLSNRQPSVIHRQLIN